MRGGVVCGVELVTAVGLVILLVSNIWLLREHEKTRGRLEQYGAEVRALEERVYHVLLDVDARLRSVPDPLGTPTEDSS